MERRKDRAPWLVLPCMLLALSGVTLLAPRRAVQAAPNLPPAATNSAPSAIDDDGDGDELLEHWGDPKYAREERLQMTGMAAGGFLLLGGLAYRRHVRRAQSVPLSLEDVTEQGTNQRKAA